MKTRYIAACVLTTCMGVWPSAYSAQFGFIGTDVTRFRTFEDLAFGFRCEATLCWSFQAQMFDDSNGVAQWFVSASLSDPFHPGTSWFIFCSGPAYANSLSVNPGKATVRALLDPSAPDCVSANVFAPVTLDLSGQANGMSSLSQTGHFTQEDGGLVFKGNNQQDMFSSTFNGTIGAVSGPFDGSATTFRIIDRQQVK